MLLLISSKMGTLHPVLLKLWATELFENKQTNKSYRPCDTVSPKMHTYCHIHRNSIETTLGLAHPLKPVHRLLEKLG